MELKEQLRAQWADMAEAWIGVVGDEVHRVGLLDRWMLDAAGDVSGLDVIDLGCGEGRFSRMLAQRGASVVGVDLCERFVEFARANRAGSEDYQLGDMEDLSAFPDARFDLAISYLTLVDVLDYARAIREAHRVLRPGGRFVVCNLQPMVTAGNGWIKHGNTKLHFKLDDYFDEGARPMPMLGREFTNFHRTLSSYVNAFLEAGFALEGLREPKPSPEQAAQFPDVADNLRVPLFIIYLLRKEENDPL
ncbi:MAG: class I SAM-dependent methyltransferase [Chloroflexi bacterium]|nr:class I SAM-dependent methyltransferase [Chloroflexota bacterium]